MISSEHLGALHLIDRRSFMVRKLLSPLGLVLALGAVALSVESRARAQAPAADAHKLAPDRKAGGTERSDPRRREELLDLECDRAEIRDDRLDFNTDEQKLSADRAPGDRTTAANDRIQIERDR